jgi:hypothetical protein
MWPFLKAGVMVMCVLLSTYGWVYTQEYPEVKSITPTSGFDYGGTMVRIEGSHFQDGVTVTFGDTEATDVRRLTSTVLTAVIPAHRVGVVDVTVTNPDGGTDTLEDGFEFVFGLFGSPTEYATSARYILSAHLDGDGDSDLVGTSGDRNTLSVFLNDGDGTFAPSIDYAVDTPLGGSSADLDGDGDNDLAVTNSQGGTVSVLLNHGDGTFAPKVDYATAPKPVGVSIADLDGDGYNDLAVSCPSDHSVSVLLNHGDGTFADKVDYAAGPNLRSVSSADLDGDGDPDLDVPNQISGTVSAFTFEVANSTILY